MNDTSSQSNADILNSHKFLPLFVIQFLNALNDNILKNAILVMITYQSFKLFGLSSELSVNIVAFMFILPFFLFSATGGKIGDAYCKVKLIRLIKYCEVLIIMLAAIGLFTKNLKILIVALVAMGIHSTFFGPIKYSILPQYIGDRKALLLANGYIECGTFVAVLLGQFFGGWYMANKEISLIISFLFASTFSGLLLSYRLEKVLPLGAKEKLNWNIFKDTFKLCQKVSSSKLTRNNIRAISWFWAIGAIYTTQLPLFTKHYLGGGPHVFSVLLVIFSMSIGVGAIFCAKISNGIVRKECVIIGAIGISVFTLILLILNRTPQSNYLELGGFSRTCIGIIDYVLVSIVGFSAGLYSVTCYNELQVESPVEVLSQIFAVCNISNAAYMLFISIVCILLLLFINIWWVLFLIVIIANMFFIYWYWTVNFIKGVKVFSRFDALLKVVSEE